VDSNSVLFLYSIVVPYCHFLGPLRFPLTCLDSVTCVLRILSCFLAFLLASETVCKAEEMGFSVDKNREAIGTRRPSLEQSHYMWMMSIVLKP
jgi:hypothetical protein